MYNEVRLYALSINEFKTECDVIRHLRITVRENGDVFHFIKYGIICPPNTLVYFRYRGAIVARAVALKRVRKNLYLQPNTMKIRRTSLQADTLGITWWEDNDPNNAEILTSNSYQGPLFIDPASIPIIDAACF